MQFSIYINQPRAMEWGLNLQQATLFAFLYDVPNWATEVIIDDRAFYWVAKGKILDELPVLTSKDDTVKRYMAVLEKAGLIERKTHKNMPLVRLTDKGKTWNCSDQVGKKIPTSGGVESGKKSRPSGEKNPDKGGKKSRPSGEKNPPNHITNDQSTNQSTNDHIDKPASRSPAKYSLEELKSFDLSNWPSLPTDQDLTEWLEVRKSKRALITQRVVTDMGTELAKAQQQFNLTVPQIFEAILTGNPWAGFKASYLENYTPPGASNEFSSPNRPGSQPFVPDNESTDWLDEAKRQQQEWEAMWAGRDHAGGGGGYPAGSDEGCRPDELPVQPASGDFHEAPRDLARPVVGECGQAGVVIDHEG